MKSTRSNCSLPYTDRLRKLIIEHPDLPLMIFAGEDAYNEDFANHCASESFVNWIDIEKLTLYHNKWIDDEDLADEIWDANRFDGQFKDMSDEDFLKEVEKIVDQAEFQEMIVVYVN